MKPIIETRDLTIRFGSLIANDRLNISIEPGKIHAIAGENGAGKSTLMKMLYGVYTPTSGKILIDGEEMRAWDASTAIAKGIRMVFQDFRLIPAFTVLENIFISLANSSFVMKKLLLRKRILEISEEYHLGVDPDEEVWKLDLGQRQHIEIIKVLINEGTRVMIFDEPTSVLAPHEISSFLDMLINFKSKGYAIVFITHKLNEIVTVADQITILRAGKITASVTREEGFDREKIVSLMLGEDISRMNVKSARQDVSFPDLPSLRLKDVCILDDHNQEILCNVNFELKRGRIVGIAGISGNGQRELAESVFGVRSIRRGSISFGTEAITSADPEKRIALGFRMVTEDPLRDNVVGSFTVLQNMVLAGLPAKTKGGRIDWKALEEEFSSHSEIRDLNVPDANRLAGTLSGGNVQRMTFARAVISNPSVLVACYPSRGLDVATVAVVHETLLRLRNGGAAVLLISEDLPELVELSDELLVLSGHRAYGPFDANTADLNEIGKLMLKGEESYV